MPDTNLNLETATLSQLNSAVQTLIAGLKEAGSTARAVFPPDSAGMFDSSVMSPAQLSRARDINRATANQSNWEYRMNMKALRMENSLNLKAQASEARNRDRYMVRQERQAIADEKRQSDWEYRMNMKSIRLQNREDLKEARFQEGLHKWASKKLAARLEEEREGKEMGPIGAILGRIPKPLREQWKMGRQVMNMSHGLSSNPVSIYNDARDIFEYAQSITSGLQGGISRVAQRLSNIERLGSSGLSRATAGFAWRALMLQGIPGMAAMGAGAVAAAIPVIYAASVKLDTMVAENTARGYEAGAKYMKHKNSMADLHGEGASAEIDRARNEIRQSMIDAERKTATSDLQHGPLAYWLSISSIGGYNPMKFFGAKSNLELSNSWLQGGGSWPTAARAVLNMGAAVINKVAGTNAQFLSQAEMDEIVNGRTEKISTKYFEMKDQADKAALDGDVSLRFKIDQSLTGEAPTFYKNLTTMTSARGIGLAYRLAHQAKIQQNQFAFIFDDWKRPRDF